MANDAQRPVAHELEALPELRADCRDHDPFSGLHHWAPLSPSCAHRPDPTGTAAPRMPVEEAADTPDDWMTDHGAIGFLTGRLTLRGSL